MPWFDAETTSEARISATREQVWEVLTDPPLLARLTPLLHSIEADADDPGLWRWEMIPIPVVGLRVVPAFTERMELVAPERIVFHHEPPDDAVERAAAEGRYDLDAIPGGTHLAIALKVAVELPVSRLARPAVGLAMKGVLATMGNRFSANLLQHLGAHDL